MFKYEWQRLSYKSKRISIEKCEVKLLEGCNFLLLALLSRVATISRARWRGIGWLHLGLPIHNEYTDTGVPKWIRLPICQPFGESPPLNMFS